SWNRAAAPQGGYTGVFQPLADGKASGPFVVFADGFAGAVKELGQAAHRPSGLAVGPDGALYISDDQRGRIWRVSYRGPATAAIAAAPAPSSRAGSSAPRAAVPPEGIHPDAGSQAAGALPTPPGATSEEVALGRRIYEGQLRARRAQAATERTPRARRSGPTSPAANGYGAMAVSLRSRTPSPS